MFPKQAFILPSRWVVVFAILVLLLTGDVGMAAKHISPKVVVEAQMMIMQEQHHPIEETYENLEKTMNRDDDMNNNWQKEEEESSTTTTSSKTVFSKKTVQDNSGGLMDTQKNIILDKIARIAKAKEQDKSPQLDGIMEGEIDFLPHSKNRKETHWVSFKEFFAKNQMEQHWFLQEYQQRDKKELKHNDDIYVGENDDDDDEEDEEVDHEYSSNIPWRGNGGRDPQQARFPPVVRYLKYVIMHYTIRVMQISLLVFGIWGDKIWQMLGIRHPPALYWTAKHFAVQLWVIFFLMVPYIWNFNSSAIDGLSMMM